MNAPKTIRQGDKYEWTETSSDYPASTHTGKTYINGSSHLTLTAAADGNDYDFTITSAQSAALTPGFYQLQVRAELGTTYHTLGVQTIEVVAGGVQAAGYDARTTARQQLDLINNAISALLASPHQTVAIGGKSYTTHSLPDLYGMQKKLEYEVEREKDAERLNQGLQRRRILTRFAKTS